MTVQFSVGLASWRRLRLVYSCRLIFRGSQRKQYYLPLPLVFQVCRAFAVDKASDQRLLIVLVVAGIGLDDDTQALHVVGRGRGYLVNRQVGRVEEQPGLVRRADLPSPG